MVDEGVQYSGMWKFCVCGEGQGGGEGVATPGEGRRAGSRRALSASFGSGLGGLPATGALACHACLKVVPAPPLRRHPP